MSAVGVTVIVSITTIFIIALVLRHLADRAIAAHRHQQAMAELGVTASVARADEFKAEARRLEADRMLDRYNSAKDGTLTERESTYARHYLK